MDLSLAQFPFKITDKVFHELPVESVGRQCFPVVQMKGPSGKHVNIRRKDDPNSIGFELLSKNLELFPSEPINTGISTEALTDLKSQYGEDAEQIIVDMLKGIISERENALVLQYLRDNAERAVDYKSADKQNAQYSMYALMQYIHNLILAINGKTFRSYESFAIIPFIQFTPIATLLGMGEYFNANDAKSSNLYIGTVGKTKIFLNPDLKSKIGYVGLFDKNLSKSSGIFGDYTPEFYIAPDPDTGNSNYFMNHRFGLSLSPLHNENNPLIYWFNCP